MPNKTDIPVQNLALDLSNFRTIPQANELNSIHAMMAPKLDYFFGLMESLLDNGYLPTENILVLETIEDGISQYIVKEGNRRIGALKLIYGYIPRDEVAIPANLLKKIDNISADWKTANLQVPCVVYAVEETTTADFVVALTHGKGDKAGRVSWSSVARARHNRDVNRASEPGLDLLEKYLQIGRNFTTINATRWAGEYPLTVLDELMPRLASRLGASNAADLANKYPLSQYNDSIEKILRDIGLRKITFTRIRSTTIDIAAEYGIPAPSKPNSNSGTQGGTNGQPNATAGAQGGEDGEAAGSAGTQGGTDGQPNGTAGAQDGTDGQSAGSAGTQGGTDGQPDTGKPAAKKSVAVAIQDPLAVKRALQKFKPVGNNRNKVVTLRNEALQLDLAKNPLAFCFILRSMFEISAKAYCEDHKAFGGPSAVKIDGSDRSLVDVLIDITAYMTTPTPGGKQDQAKVRELYSAITDLRTPNRILSVMSLNQLIHNPVFLVSPDAISLAFGNIFPLLLAMNS
jgi:hypothetical protein